MNALHTPARFVLLLFVVFAISFAQPPIQATALQQAKDAILQATDISGRIFPATVFLRGQTTTVEMDNVGGVRYADGPLVVAALVDSSGYASRVREKYQGYLFAEVPIEIGGQTLKPGGYGFGFLDNNQFAVMDVGANDVLQAISKRDAEIRRPVPLQFVAAEGDGAGGYRLYHGRDYIVFQRVKQ